LADLFETQIPRLDNLAIVEAIATADPHGRDTEVARSLSSAASVERAIINYPPSQWEILRGKDSGARTILDKVAQAADAHEAVQSLPATLAAAAADREEWLRRTMGPRASPPAPSTPSVFEPEPEPRPANEQRRTFTGTASEVEAQLVELLGQHPQSEFTVEIRWRET
jgi:hypothetical protein